MGRDQPRRIRVVRILFIALALVGALSAGRGLPNQFGCLVERRVLATPSMVAETNGSATKYLWQALANSNYADGGGNTISPLFPTTPMMSSAAATVRVNSTTDVSDGDTSSIAGLLATPGPDGVISLREAIT